MGRGGAGGEDRNVCSIWNGSPGTRKPCGKHPLDGEIFLNKNKNKDLPYGITFLSSIGKVHITLGCSRLGILFENPLKLHTLILVLVLVLI